MSISWTDEQLTAIETTDKNLLVCASAGSGKTAVLVERIIRLIENKHLQTDEILAITFTKAAAGELKQRIRKALKEKIRSSQGEDLAYFSMQAEKLENASISTLHAFCYGIIKKYYYILGTDPQSRIMSDEQMSILSSECIDEVYEQYYQSDDISFEEFIDTLSTGRDDEAIKDNIISAYDSLRNLEDYQKKLETFLGQYPKDEKSFLESTSVQFIKGRAGEILTEAKYKYELALSISKDVEDGKMTVTNNIASIIELIDLLLGKLEYGFKEFMLAYENTSFPRAAAATKLERSDEIIRHRDAGKALLNDLAAYIPFNYETFLYYSVSMYPHVLKFGEVMRRYEEVLSERKKEDKLLDYSDLEHLCLKVLENDAAREEIKSSFKQVLVDEYQDINGVQEAIISRLCSEDNLFCVGDIKQSIYRFRQADPSIFAGKYDEYQRGENDKNLLVHLNNNFRSVPVIIDFVNLIFSQVMFDNTGGVDFFPNEMMKASIPQEEIAPVNLRIIDCSGYIGTDVEDSKDAEAAYVAALIKNEILPEGKFAPENIAVIDRAMNSKADYFIRAFEAVGIDADVRENTKYYDAFEVSLVINMLRLIDNIYNDMALLTVMRSFIYNFSEDDLTQIRGRFRDCMYYHEAFIQYAQSGEDTRLKDKVNRMLEDISRYRYISRHISISNLIRNIYEEKSILQFVGAMREGEKRISNLEELINIASEYENSNLKGLYDFILYADKCKEKMQLQNSATQKGGVKLMTTHSSKGLEFDVVIVTGCGTAFKNKDRSYSISIDKDFGICTKFTDTLIGYKANTLELIAAKENRRDENKAEEMRILYVAATRAKKRLYMTAALKEYKADKHTYTERMGTYEISKATSYLDWIKYAIDTYDGDLSGIVDISVDIPWNTEVSFRKTGRILPFEDTKGNTQTISTIRENFDYVYPHNSKAIPTKLSVSDLKDETVMLNERLVQRQSIKEAFENKKDAKNAAHRGSLIHKVLEVIDLTDLRDRSIASVLEDMKSESRFFFETLTNDDIRMICTFFEGDIGRMMLAADRIHREQPFILSVNAGEINDRWKASSDTILVQGIIDCWFEYDGEIYLIDFKTDRIKDDEHLKELNEKYSKQLSYYKRAIELSTGRRVNKSYICYLRKNIITNAL